MVHNKFEKHLPTLREQIHIKEIINGNGGCIMYQLNQNSYLIKHAPHSMMLYKDLNSTIIQYHSYGIDSQRLFDVDNLVGKKMEDIFAPETAELVRKQDILIMNNKNVTFERQELFVDNVNAIPYFIVKSPWTDVFGNVIGVMSNILNISLYSKQNSKCFADKKDLYLNTGVIFKEMLLITNIIKSSEINGDVKILCSELQKFIKMLVE